MEKTYDIESSEDSKESKQYEEKLYKAIDKMASRNRNFWYKLVIFQQEHYVLEWLK